MRPTGGGFVSVVTDRGYCPEATRPEEEQRAGVGLQEWSDGSRYEGDFVNGFKHGRGRYTWKNGECYEGSFFKDFRHGDGVYCWPSGHKFIGKFYLNRKEGYGQQLFPDGSDFQGLYRADQRFGPGVMTYPDGRQDVGLWHNERLLRLCTTLDEGFTLKDFPEYAAYMNTGTATEECVPWSHSRLKDSKKNCYRDQFLDDNYILPPGIETFSTDGDHLPLPPGRRKELDQHFFGDVWVPDGNPYLGFERDPLSSLPLEARMHAHIHKHRFHANNLSWNVSAVLSLNRKGFGPKGPLEVSSELLIRQASQGNQKTVSQILRSGTVHPDVADALRYTALMAATVICCDDVIDVLLDKGVDIDKVNCENMSALAMCHVLYYPFHSLHTSELHTVKKLMKSPGATQSGNDRPGSTETVPTHSHVFSGGAVEELTEQVLRHSEVSTQSELVTVQQCTMPNKPQATAGRVSVTEDWTEERQDEEEQETEINETEEVTSEEVDGSGEAEDDIEQDLNENKKDESQSEDGVDRSIEGELKGLNKNPTFEATSSVNSFQIHVTEEAMQRSAEALSRTGITPSLDSQETVHKMAAMKTENHAHFNTLKLLLDRGADPNACRIPMPVLFLAVMASDVEAVRRLLLCGAHTDIPLPPERNGLYPLHVAAALPGPAGPKITELLLHAITDPDARACDQNQVYKIDRGTINTLRATVDTRDREGGTTALHLACQRDDDYQNASKIVALLLSHGARTDLLWSGHSPLSLAIASGNEMAVEELLKGGADPNVPLGNRVGSALCALANNNYYLCGNRQKLLDMLVKAGADILMPVEVDNVQATAVDFAYYSFNQDTRISSTPYHALNIQESEKYKERQLLLKMMGNKLRQTALQREKERQQDADSNTSIDEDRPPQSSTPQVKFCYHCCRSASVKLIRCSRCRAVFYCSKTCKVKAWNKGHKNECNLVTTKSVQLQTSKPSTQRKSKEAADAAPKNVSFMTQREATKVTLKSKPVLGAFNAMYIPKITKLKSVDMKTTSLKATAVEDQANKGANYSFI